MNALAAEIDAMIAVEGPMPISRYMALCLGHPVHGYYMRRDPLGAEGDFVTSPEISQVFGELIGLWCVDVWNRMGAPGEFVLAELGPGRGTLMTDALRASRVVPEFRAAARLHLVETSPVLRERQRDWRDDVGEADLRGGDAGDHDVRVGVEQVLDHHHRVVALLERLAVEERRELRQRLPVVVDGDRHVLLVRGELVGDLLVELGHERVGGHRGIVLS